MSSGVGLEGRESMVGYVVVMVVLDGEIILGIMEVWMKVSWLV